MTNKQNTVLCFSGHRYYAGLPEDEARLFSALREAYDEGFRVFVSGMAPGFDLAAGEAVLRLRDSSRAGGGGGDVRLVAAVPFAGQQRGYSAGDLARYERLLQAADQVHVLAERYSHGCYYRRDDWMVERSRRIVCWYDGSGGASGRAARSGGGTRYTVRRAVARGLEVVNIFRSPGSLF